MSPLATFIVLVICFELIRHLYRAFKRIRALEADLLETQKNLNDHLDITQELSRVVYKILDISGDHDTELMALRARTHKLKESHEHPERPETE